MERRISGFILAELMLVIMILGILSAMAAPSVLRFYRQAALEYETEHLLADLRRIRSMSRQCNEPAYGYGQNSVWIQKVFINLNADSYDIWAKGGTLKYSKRFSHKLMPMIKMSWPNAGGDSEFSFRWNSGLTSKGMMGTIVLMVRGHPEEQRWIRINRSGRLRIERGGKW